MDHKNGYFLTAYKGGAQRSPYTIFGEYGGMTSFESTSLQACTHVNMI
jgi:hypothetical protein